MLRKPLLYLPLVGLLLSPLVLDPASAGNPATNATATVRPGRRVIFQPPPNERAPRQAIGAGSRGTGQCSINDPAVDTRPLAVLAPPNAIGRTVAERPVISVYVPSGTAKRIALSVAEEESQARSIAFFPVPEKSGIVHLQLPSDSPPLAIGKTYRWAAVLLCGDRPSPNDPAITGLVTRVALPETPPRGDLIERARWYGARGIWYDALESLSLAWRQNPDDGDFPVLWSAFLRSAGLESIPEDSRPF